MQPRCDFVDHILRVEMMTAVKEILLTKPGSQKSENEIDTLETCWTVVSRFHSTFTRIRNYVGGCLRHKTSIVVYH